MKSVSVLRCSAFGLVTAASLVPIMRAQPSAPATQNRYLILSYFKSKPGRATEYVKYEREYWKGIHEPQVRNAQMTYWKLFAVEFPGGEEREYDYVTVVECAKFSDLEASITDLESEEALGDSKRAESVNVGRPAKMVRQDVAAIVESTENWPSAKTGYLRVRFMKPREGKSAALTDQERDIWKPYYEDAVRAGINTGWAFSTLRFAAEDNPYTRIWFSAMAQFNDTDGHPPPELAKKWESRFRTLPRADELRKVVRDELWRLVDQTAGAR